MNITIQHKDLKAVSYAMSKKDVRYYLNGVYIEAGNGQARLIATDGHRLHAVQFDALQAQSALFTAIMPASFVLTLLKQKKQKEFLLEFTNETVQCTLYESIAMSKLIDGRFPDYCRVIPSTLSTLSGTVAMFNPEYLVDLNEAARAYHNSNEVYTPKHAGKDGGIYASGGFVAVIMPLQAITGDSLPVASWNMPLTGYVPLPAGFEQHQDVVNYANSKVA